MRKPAARKPAAERAVDEVEAEPIEHLPDAVIGEPYRHQLRPGHDTMPPWAFSLPTKVAGLSLKNAGLLVGTPEGPATGDQPLTLTITSHDGNGEEAVTDYLLAVVAPDAPAEEAQEQAAEEAAET